MQSTLKRAEEYYTLVKERNIEGVRERLHPDVELKGPLASHKGKEAVVEATRSFMNTFRSLTIRTKIGSGEQAMIIYDVDVPEVSPSFFGASHLTFKEGLIVKIELYFDGSRFIKS